MDTHDEKNAPAYGPYVVVWALLIGLTALTVAVAHADMHHLAIFAALLIAVAKTGLVLLYFMHLRHEKPVFFYMILAVLVTYGIFIGLTLADYVYR